MRPPLRGGPDRRGAADYVPITPTRATHEVRSALRVREGPRGHRRGRGRDAPLRVRPRGRGAALSPTPDLGRRGGDPAARSGADVDQQRGAARHAGLRRLSATDERHGPRGDGLQKKSPAGGRYVSRVLAVRTVRVGGAVAIAATSHAAQAESPDVSLTRAARVRRVPTRGERPTNCESSPTDSRLRGVTRQISGHRTQSERSVGR